MKKRQMLSLALCLALCVSLCNVHAEAAERWETVKNQCEELGLSVTWYPESEGLMRRYGTGRMLLVEEGKSFLCKLNSAERLAGPFDAFGEFNKDGLAPACQNGRWGMVDRNGKAVVEFVYPGQYEAELAGETYPMFKGKNGKDAPPYALFTRDGEQLTEYKYQAHDRFINGFAMVTEDGKHWGFVRADGRDSDKRYRHTALNTAKYAGEDDYGIFGEDGLAVVCTERGFNILDGSSWHEWLALPLAKQPWRAGCGYWGYVDPESGKVGFLNGSGGRIILPRFDDVTTPKGYQQTYCFDERGLADVCENGEYYTIDLRGNRVDRAAIPWEPTGEDALHEALRRVQTGENGPWGFVDESGKEVVPALFDAVGYFDYGYASVLVDGVFGLLRNPLLTIGKTTASDKEITFTDIPAGSWFENGVMTCARSGVMVGVGENTFSPNTTLTDAECAMLAYRIYDQANGGDGSVMKMPEDWNYLKLVSADGSYVHEGYAGDDEVWQTVFAGYSSDGIRLKLPRSAPMGAAVLTFGGKEYPGMVKDGSHGSGRYEMDHFTYFEAEDVRINKALSSATWAAPPDRWWADLVYTIWQKGWEEIFLYDIQDGEATRSRFAERFGKVTDLPKRFDVQSIPDWGPRGGGNPQVDQVYELYEAGIIGGVDVYGTFAPGKTLTRAEAAVMVARVLDESQRLAAPHRSLPTEGEGYTLTYLRDGVFSSWHLLDTYPYCVVGAFEEGDSTYAHPVGLLTLEGEYTPWTEELQQEKEEDIKAPYGWRNWGGLETGGTYYRWSDGAPATEHFDWCGKIGPGGRGFVQKGGKLYRIQFDPASEKAAVRPERPTLPPDTPEGMEYLYDFTFYDRYAARVDENFRFGFPADDSQPRGEYALFLPVEGALEGAAVESVDGDGLTPYQLKRYKQDGPDGTLVVGVHSYPLDGIEYISYLWTDRPGVYADGQISVGDDEYELMLHYHGDLRLIEKGGAELDWMSSHSTWDFDELYVWQPFTPENNDCRDATFYMKDGKVAAMEMTAPFELRYVYGHDAEEELRRAEQRKKGG